jgi:hypothetical protein
MPVILNDQPIPSRDTVTFIGTEQIRVRADQIIVWVSLTVRNVLIGNPDMRRFPALLDTGMNHYFALQERHLEEWAGLRASDLVTVGSVRDRGQDLSLYAVSLFLFPIIAHNTDVDAGQVPIRMALPRGIAVYPTAGAFPRLPLLGLKAILHNRLRLIVSGDRRRVTLRTPRRCWPFS